jgi:NDP-mannose synthase
MSERATALVMAGGRSERMRATHGPVHKALVPILGVPMIERNLCALLAEQFNDIVISYNAREPGIEDYLQTQGRELLRSRGAAVEVLREEQPLGTIGAAGLLRDRTGPVLVVNVDNLTTLGLRRLVAHHAACEAALTIAVHSEPFRIPFGAVTVRDGQIVIYAEKPVYPVTVSSGTYVLSFEARGMIPQRRRFDLPALFSMLMERNRKVAAYEHSAPWIDVNDGVAVSRAEQLILENYDDFELWRISPDTEVTETFLYEGRRVSRVGAERGAGEQPRLITAFDELCIPGGRLIRHKIEVLPAEAGASRANEQAWISLDAGIPAPNTTIERCLAVLRKYL